MPPVPVTLAVNSEHGSNIKTKLDAQVSGITVEEVIDASRVMNDADITTTDCLVTPFGEGDPTASDIYSYLRSAHPDHPTIIASPNDDRAFIEEILSDENSEYVFIHDIEEIPAGILSARIQRLVNR